MMKSICRSNSKVTIFDHKTPLHFNVGHILWPMNQLPVDIENSSYIAHMWSTYIPTSKVPW